MTAPKPPQEGRAGERQACQHLALQKVQSAPPPIALLDAHIGQRREPGCPSRRSGSVAKRRTWLRHTTWGIARRNSDSIGQPSSSINGRFFFFFFCCRGFVGVLLITAHPQRGTASVEAASDVVLLRLNPEALDDRCAAMPRSRARSSTSPGTMAPSCYSLAIRSSPHRRATAVAREERGAPLRRHRRHRARRRPRRATCFS